MNDTPRPAMPEVERGGNITIIAFVAGAIRDVENVIARELGGLTEGTSARHLLLDFSNGGYLSSIELGTLITLHKRAQAAGGQLTLFNLGSEVFRLFSVTRLDTLLASCREDAVAPPTPDDARHRAGSRTPAPTPRRSREK